MITWPVYQKSRLSQMNEPADGSGSFSQWPVSLCLDPSLHRLVRSLRSVKWAWAPSCGGRALLVCSGAVTRPSTPPLSLAPVMDDLGGVMNRLLSAFHLIWDSDSKTEEHRHHPAGCLKYSSYLGKEGCAGESWDVWEGTGDVGGFYMWLFI